MRYFYVMLIALCSFGTAAQAQEVFKAVKESAQRISTSPTATIDQVRIAQFKLSALNYLWDKSFEMKDEVTDLFLNTQAYYLNDFMTQYQTQIALQENKGQDQLKSVVTTFMSASLSYPLFFDPDTERSEIYIPHSEDESVVLTPFSLDTDWEQASGFIRQKFNLQ